MANKNELACVYSALILVDDDISITGEKISTILKAAKVDVEPYWPGLFAKALDGIDVRAMITNIGSGVGVGGGGAAVAASPVAEAPAAEAPPKEEEKKKEESEPESDEDLGFGLFD